MDRLRSRAFLLAGVWVLLGIGSLWLAFRPAINPRGLVLLVAFGLMLIFTGAVSFADRLGSLSAAAWRDRRYLENRDNVALMIPLIAVSLLGCGLGINGLVRPLPDGNALRFSGPAARVTIDFWRDPKVGQLSIWTTANARPLTYQCGRYRNRGSKAKACPAMAAWRSLPEDQKDVAVALVAEGDKIVAAKVADVVLVDLAREERAERTGAGYALAAGLAVLALCGALAATSWRRMRSFGHGQNPDLLF